MRTFRIKTYDQLLKTADDLKDILSDLGSEGELVVCVSKRQKETRSESSTTRSFIPNDEQFRLFYEVRPRNGLKD